ncbi:MAG TPA: hypothetical protein VFR97_07795 [Capillimicrobium sp.]|nr:hypothetical protein [Capillimicrobium sp.]
MRAHRMLVAGVAVCALAIPGAAALAASPADECAATGGTYSKDGGTAVCTYPVGQSDNTKVTSQKGSFNSSHDETFENPGGTFPPGQQGGNDVGK